MSKFLTSTQRMNFVLVFILLLSTMQLSQATRSQSFDATDLSADSDDADDNNSAMEEQQRPNDLRNRLRYFLLTSNAEQRAARRKQQDSLKQDLVIIIYSFLRIFNVFISFFFSNYL